MTKSFAALFFVFTCTFAQSFEVATIKPGNPGDRRKMFGIMPGGRFSASNVTARELILFAYDLKEQQLSGGPGWANSDTWDLVAKPESTGSPDQINPEQIKIMMRALLTDRFQLTLKRDSKELSVYNLVVAKNGPKMTGSKDADRAKRNVRMGRGQVEGQQMSMQMLADVLSRVSGRPILDKTGLTGTYDLKLEWTPDVTDGPIKVNPAEPPPSDTSGPSLFTAIQEQLGLKLEAQKAPVDVYIVERVEKPSEN
jgi:uncharacterized protein (TIGR03435 family)